MSQIKKALLFSSLNQYLLKLLALVSTMVFARLLTPHELGIYAIASSVLIIVSELKTLGVAKYLIREKDLSPEKVKAALGLSILISWSLGISLLVMSKYIADFYEISNYQALFQVFALNFFLSPFISTFSALISRQLKFQNILAARFSCEATTFAVSLAFVLNGHSIFSLAYGAFSGTVVELLLLLIMRPPNSTLIPSFTNLKPVFKFGIFTSSANMLAKFSTIAPDLMLGKLSTPTNVAMFSKGIGLNLFVSQILVKGVNPVILPYLSKTKSEGACIRDAYLQATFLLCSILWPVLACVSAASYPAVMILFGDQWKQAVPLASIIAIWTIVRSTHGLSASLFITAEKENLLLYRQFIQLVLTVTAIYLCFPYGLEAIAWGMVGAAAMDFLIVSVFLQRAIDLSLVSFLIKTYKNLILAGACWIVTKGIDQLFPFESTPLYQTAIMLVVLLPITWLATAMLTKHQIYSEIMKIVRRK